MPADHGRRVHDVEVIAPGRPNLPEPDPEHSVGVGQAGGRVGPKSNLKLVAENDVFKRDVATRAEKGNETANEYREE
jgi:hypothetical protein